tara:strand:- start:1094 stop:1681 length:588 start_codon:yes stop_codon:yes gene_type:complete
MKKKKNIHDDTDSEVVEDVDFDEQDYSKKELDKTQKLKNQLNKCLAEKKEYLDGWQRSRAEYANIKKEFENSRSYLKKIAHEEIIVDILPVLDSFEMAFANKDLWEKVDKNWRMGVEHIHNQMTQILDNYGLSACDDIGKKFDPMRHTSVETVGVDSKSDDGVIIDVIQRGYTLGDTIVRSARVSVGEYRAKKNL